MRVVGGKEGWGTPLIAYINVYGGTPPLGDKFIAPSLPPIVVTLLTKNVAVRAAGSVIVYVLVTICPAASLTVIVYTPADKEFKSSVIDPLLQLYEYGGIPPVTDKLTLPSEEPLQLTFEVTAVINGRNKQLPSSHVADTS